MCAGSLESVLHSSYFTNFINNQQEAAKTFLTSLRKTTCEHLNKAQLSKNPDDFKQAFLVFKNLYNEHCLILDGFTLNPLLEETDTQPLAELDTQIIQLRQQFTKNQAEKTTEIDFSNEVNMDAKIKNQREILSENLQDKLTYGLIYKKITGATDDDDAVFYRIKSTQKLKNSPAERSQVFINELKIEINKSSMNSFSKMIFKCLLPVFHHLIGRYTKSFTTNIFESLNTTLDKIDKKDIVTRASNCFSKYNAILNEWSTLESGGDKRPVIKGLISKSRYLTYEEENYTQNQLYNEVSNNLIDNHFNIYENAKAPTFRLKNLMKKTHHFAMKKLFTSNNILASTLNYTFIGVKIVAATLPTYLVLGPIIPLVQVFENFMNGLTKLLLKKTLSHFNVINTLVTSTRNGIYENNPYVHAITSFLADQLENLSTELEASITNPQKKTSRRKEKPHVSDITRSLLKSTFEHLIEIINKNPIGTQEKLKEFLKNKGPIDRLDENLQQVILPSILESVIDVTLLASNSLNKKSLQKPIALLLNQINALITIPHNTSPQALKEKRQEQIAAEEKLTKYTDKILKQTITKTVNDTISSIGQSGPEFANEIKTWLQTTLNGETGRIATWEKFLKDFNDPEKTEKQRFDIMQDFYSSLKDFIDEVTDKHDHIKQMPDRIFQTLGTQFAKIITPLSALSNKENGVLALYKNQHLVYQTNEDRRHFIALEQTYKAIHQSLETMKTEAWLTTPTQDMLTTLETNSTFLNAALSNLKNKTTPLLRDADLYEGFFNLINVDQQADRTRSISAIQESYLPALDILKDLQRKIDPLKDTKNRYLQTHRFWKSDKRDPFILAHQTFLAQLKKIRVPQTRALLIAKLQTLYNANSSTAVDAAYTDLNNQIDTAIKKQKHNINQSIQRIINIDLPIYESTKTFVNTYDSEIKKYQNKNNSITPRAEALLQTLATQAETWETISFIPMQTSILNSLKSFPSAAAYQFFKPKVMGAFDLIRDGNFAQFFVNHTLMMPLAKK